MKYLKALWHWYTKPATPQTKIKALWGIVIVYGITGPFALRLLILAWLEQRTVANAIPAMVLIVGLPFSIIWSLLYIRFIKKTLASSKEVKA